MEKLKLVFDELNQKYKTLQSFKNAPEIHWLNIDKSLSEDYQADYAGGRIAIKAYGFLGAIYALQTMHTAITSGHLVDFLGFTSPYIKIRPLCLEENLKFILNNPLQIHEFCKKILELGYNALVVNQIEDVAKLKSLCSNLKSYGLLIILKPSLLQIPDLEGYSPLNKKYENYISDYLKKILTQNICFDYFFWESLWIHYNCTNVSIDGFTLEEMILKEAKCIENLLNDKTLIFHVPAIDEKSALQCASWLPNFADNLGKDTILAFSGVAGNNYADFKRLHPLWDQLRLKIKSSSSAFMPIFNIGNVRQGEGLWPVIMQDLIEESIARCRNNRFIGILTLANHLPAESGIHECNLWTASQAMRKNLSSSLLIETWFMAFRTDWNYHMCSSLLNQMRAISKNIARMRSLTIEVNRDQISTQECRQFAESVQAQLNEIQIILEKEENKKIKKSEKTTLLDYFSIFSNDVRKIILHILQCFNITPNIDENQIKESFWTEFNIRPGQGTRSNAKVIFLNTPNKGTPNSRMNRIYKENRLFE